MFIQAYLTSNKSKLMAITKLTCMRMNGFKINTTSPVCQQHCPQNKALTPSWLPSREGDRAQLQGQVGKWPALAAPLSPSVLISRMERTTAVLQISPSARGRPCGAKDHACVFSTVDPS